MSPRKSIVWLASYPKSGNTWLRMFLEALLQNSNAPLNLSGRMRYTGLRDFAPEVFAGLSAKSVGELSTEEVYGLRRESHVRMSNMAAPFVFAKTHAPDKSVLGHDLFFGETTAKAVCVVRNPLDIADSFADHMGVDLEEAIDRMANPNHFLLGWKKTGEESSTIYEYLSSWSVNVNSWTLKPRFPTFVMRYEDMLNDPFEQFSNLVRFIGAPFGPAQIRSAIDLSSIRNLKQAENRRGFSEVSESSKSGVFFREGKSGRWRDKLTRKQARTLIKTHKSTMKRLGYKTNI